VLKVLRVLKELLEKSGQEDHKGLKVHRVLLEQQEIPEP
jgi:hypothetical protein